MARHVPAHRFADAAAGRLSDRQLARMSAHVHDCEQCRAVRQRVIDSRAAMRDIHDGEAPELHWEHIGARIYWVTSSEQRAAERARSTTTAPSRRRMWLGATGATVVVAAGVLLFVLSRGDATMRDQAVAPLQPVTPGHKVAVGPTEHAVKPAADPVTGVVTFAKGQVALDGADLQFDTRLRAGHTLSTKRGAVAVQFDNASGFWVAPNSSVKLRSFDSRRVELVVNGSVSVNITKRSPGQYFAVVAGSRRVEVRGTAFQVDFRGGRLGVSCVRGHVVVTDGRGAVSVRAGQMVHVADTQLLSKLAAASLPARQHAQVGARAEFPMLPAWADANAMLATSATLRVTATPGRIVNVDGVRRGVGSFALRVMSGRHHVQARGAKGQWVELAAGKTGGARVASAPRAGRSLRHRQLRNWLGGGNGRLRRCLRPLIKQGMDAGAFVELDIGVTRSGVIGHLNVVRSSPSQIGGCIRAVVQQMPFPRGPAASFRYRAKF